MTKLHLGCGKHYLKGYINIDLPFQGQSVMEAKADVYKDIRKLEYDENSVDEIRHHHLLEHFTRQEALKLILQWRKWLKSGGLLVIETPDFEECFKFFLGSNFKNRFRIARHIFGSHESDWAIHRDFWDKDKFEFVLNKLGFEVVSVEQFDAVLGKIPKTSRLIKKIPTRILRKPFADLLPNILVKAKKNDKEVDEKVTVREILSMSLVGSEKEILEAWMKEVFKK
jgi:predicted SAM-dependent methyltransferase